MCLVAANYHVVVIGRDRQKGQQVLAEFAANGGTGSFERADLSSVGDTMALAHRIAQRHGELHALVLNAGAHLAERTVTAEGNETTLAMNVLTPTALLLSLRQQLVAGAPSRVVFVSSDAHRFARSPLDDIQAGSGYRGFDVYARTKLLEVLVARHVATELERNGVDVFAVNPGAAWTEQTAKLRPSMFPLPMRLNWPMMRLVQRRSSVERAAVAPVAAVLDGSLLGKGGAWINSKGQVDRPSRLAQDHDLAREAFDLVLKLLAASRPGTAA